MYRNRECDSDQAKICALQGAQLREKLEDYAEVIQIAVLEGTPLNELLARPSITIRQNLAGLAIDGVMTLREEMQADTCAACILNTLIDDTIPGILGEK